MGKSTISTGPFLKHLQPQTTKLLDSEGFPNIFKKNHSFYGAPSQLPHLVQGKLLEDGLEMFRTVSLLKIPSHSFYVYIYIVNLINIYNRYKKNVYSIYIIIKQK